VLELQDGTKKNWQTSTTHTGLHKTNTKWLVHSWSTFSAKTNHGQFGLTRLTTARTWGKPPPSPYSILCTSLQGSHPNGFLSQDSHLGIPKLPTLGFLRLWGLITLCVDLRLRWCLNQSYSPRQEFSNGMSHATCMQGNLVDSWFLMVKSQTANLSSNPSFGHNLCFRCPNGSCEPILDIYVSIAFQWYKKLVNEMGFDPYDRTLKIWESTGTPTPKMGVPLGMWGSIPSHSLAPLGACGMTLNSLLARNLATTLPRSRAQG
jgi:hypothetical protein